jgi:hypothetical protein
MVVEEAEQPVQLSALSARKCNASRASGPLASSGQLATSVSVLAAATLPLARRAAASSFLSMKSLPGLGTWRLGGRDVQPDRVVCWAGSRSPSLLESLLASLDEVLGSGLVLAERLGAMTGMGSRRQVHPPKTPPHPPKIPNATTTTAKTAFVCSPKALVDGTVRQIQCFSHSLV